MYELFPSVGPPFFGRSAELYGVAEDFLKRAGIKEGEKIIILTDTRKDLDIINAFFGAALALGADAHVLISPPLESLGDPPPWIIEFLKKADLVINLLTMEWGKQRSHQEVIDAGTRIAMVVETATSLLKMRPSEKVLKRVENFVKLLDKSESVKITSRAGTDIVFKKSSEPVQYLNGLLDAERKVKWTNFPNSIVSFPFVPESGNGILVVEPGDVLIHLRHVVREPIRLTIEKSRIIEIEGGYDADVLRKKWFDRWNDPDAYDLLHLSFGCDHRAEVHPNVYAPMEWESYAGGVLFGWGKLTHMDIMVTNTTVEVDGIQIIREGKIVHPELV
jgi:2,5-dihydroxypyridine 5,6-dioxygenase